MANTIDLDRLPADVREALRKVLEPAAPAKPAPTMTPVMLGTARQNLWFGYVPVGTDLTATTLTLTRARQVVYWEGRGAAALLVDGPSAKCRVTAAAPAAMVVHEVTAVGVVSEAAAAKFEAGPWVA